MSSFSLMFNFNFLPLPSHLVDPGWPISWTLPRRVLALRGGRRSEDAPAARSVQAHPRRSRTLICRRRQQRKSRPATHISRPATRINPPPNIQVAAIQRRPPKTAFWIISSNTAVEQCAHIVTFSDCQRHTDHQSK